MHWPHIFHFKFAALTVNALAVKCQIVFFCWSISQRSKLGSRGSDKQRKKLADLEAQLVLASPNLVFRVGNRTAGRTYTFFLSSEFERTQWIEAVHALQVQYRFLKNYYFKLYDYFVEHCM